MVRDTFSSHSRYHLQDPHHQMTCEITVEDSHKGLLPPCDETDHDAPIVHRLMGTYRYDTCMLLCPSNSPKIHCFFSFFNTRITWRVFEVTRREVRIIWIFDLVVKGIKKLLCGDAQWKILCLDFLDIYNSVNPSSTRIAGTLHHMGYMKTLASSGCH
jgi:hypothetical protein